MFDNSLNNSDVSSIRDIIQDIAQNEIRKSKSPSYISAIVKKINEDGTVDVYIPPNASNSVTKLLNKCNEPLLVGDSVEIGTKNGSLTNCWIALKHGTTYQETMLTSIFEKIYPVGSIYSNANVDTNPAELFGFGIWEKLEDVFLLASSNTYKTGTTGGEATHILTIEEMPKHSHPQRARGVGKDIAAGGSNVGAEFLGTSNTSIGNTFETGGGKSHNNMPPFKAVNMWIRIK